MNVAKHCRCQYALGWLRELGMQVVRKVAMDAIGVVEGGGNPADATLGEHDLQRRVSLEDAREHEVRPQLAERLERHGEIGAEAAGAVVVG
jgi:hypothetical protein